MEEIISFYFLENADLDCRASPMDFLTIGLLKAIVTGKNKNGTGPYHGSLNKSPIKTYHSSPVPRAAPVGNI